MQFRPKYPNQMLIPALEYKKDGFFSQSAWIVMQGAKRVGLLWGEKKTVFSVSLPSLTPRFHPRSRPFLLTSRARVHNPGKNMNNPDKESVVSGVPEGSILGR